MTHVQASMWQIVALGSTTMTITGGQIRRERNRRKLSQAELGAATGVSTTTVGRIERGDVKDPRSLEAVAQYLGLGPAPERADSEPDLTAVTVYALLDEIARRAIVAEQIIRDTEIHTGPAPDDLDADPDDVIHGPRRGFSPPSGVEAQADG